MRRVYGRAGALPNRSEGIRSVRFRLFSPDDRLKTVVSKITGFSAAEMITPTEPSHQCSSNGTGEASGGRPNVPFLQRLAVGTELSAGPGCSNDSLQPWMGEG
jgi:hypothetical protein